VKNCFYSILQILKNLSVLLQKSKDSLTENDLQLVYGLRNYTTIHFGVYKNMKTLLTDNFQWKREAKRRIRTIIAHTSQVHYYRDFSLPNFEGINRDFICGKSDYFYIRIERSPLDYDHIKYRYLSSTGKTFIIFEFQKLFSLQEMHNRCDHCQKPYLKKYDTCPDCVITPKTSILNKKTLVSNISKKVRDLTPLAVEFDKDKELLRKSQVKRLGFSLREFYEDYIYISEGSKPVIEWSDNELLNKAMFQQVLSKLEKQRRLIKLFYNTSEWNTRKTEVLERDGDICRIFATPSNSVHHRVSATYNPEICLDPKNLITICKHCHNKIRENS